MSYATTTITFADGMQVTSARLNEIMSGFRLASQSVDATTITLSSGVLSVGVLSAANYGGLSIPRSALVADIIDGTKLADDSVDSEHYVDGSIDEVHLADGAVAWVKSKSADRATQADMQSETAFHFVSPDVIKHHPGVSKAGGTVAFDNGVTTITGGYNVTSASDTGSAREITLAVTMANTNYRVQVTGNGGGAPWAVTGKTTTKFTVDGPTEASGRTFTFEVFGQLA